MKNEKKGEHNITETEGNKGSGNLCKLIIQKLLALAICNIEFVRKFKILDTMTTTSYYHFVRKFLALIYVNFKKYSSQIRYLFLAYFIATLSAA